MMTLPTANDSPGPTASPRSWLLWVDGGGGFLLLDQPRFLLGGPASGGSNGVAVDDDGQTVVAVQADLRRREAELSRHSGRYVLAPRDGRVQMGPQRIHESAFLRSDDRFQLGSGVAFHFDVPHPLSGSARLRVDRRTRFRPHVDAVLWLDDTLVLGPTDDCHVRVSHAEGPLVMMRRQDAWQVKPVAAGESWRALTPGRRLEGLGISFLLESL